MQDRLTKEMRLANISSIDEANEFLRTSKFIERHNAKFAVRPTQKENAHKDSSEYNLNSIFCIKEYRVLANDYTITYNKRIYQLRADQRTIRKWPPSKGGELGEASLAGCEDESIVASIRNLLSCLDTKKRPLMRSLVKACKSVLSR